MCLACVQLFWGLASLRACGGNARFVSVLSDSVPGFLLLQHLALAPRLRCHCKKGEDAEHSRGRVGEKQVRPQDSRPPGVRPHHHNITTERRHHCKKGEDTERKLGKNLPGHEARFQAPSTLDLNGFQLYSGETCFIRTGRYRGPEPKTYLKWGLCLCGQPIVRFLVQSLVKAWQTREQRTPIQIDFVRVGDVHCTHVEQTKYRGNGVNSTESPIYCAWKSWKMEMAFLTVSSGGGRLLIYPVRHAHFLLSQRATI